MDVMELIRDKFSQDCSIETVKALVMEHFGLSEEKAEENIKDYFDIIDAIDRERGQR